MKDGVKGAQVIPRGITLLLTLLLAFVATFFTIAFAWKPMLIDPLSLLIPLAGAGQPVSNTPNIESERPAMAIDGGNIYVAWREETAPRSEIYFNKKALTGSWSGNVNVSNDDTRNAAAPAIAVTSNDVHLVWQDEFLGSYDDIAYKQSNNGGTSWWVSREVIPDGGNECLVPPAITLSGTVPHVVWGEDAAELHIFYSNRAEGSWLGSPVNLTVGAVGDAEHPNIGAGNYLLHATWDVDSGTGHFIEYKKSVDGGTNWSAPPRDISGDVTNDGDSTHPDIAVLGNTVFVVWDTRIQTAGGNITYTIRFNKSVDGGENWLTSSTVIATPTINTGFMSPFPVPRVAISDSNTIYVAWHQGTGKADVMSSVSTDGGVTWSATPDNVSNSSENAQLARVAVGSAHVVWEEQVNGYYDIFHKSTTGTEEGGGIYLPIIVKKY